MNPVVIIGASAAGMSAASIIKRQNKSIDVIVFSKEPHISYAACGMPYYISGLVREHEKLMALSINDAISKRGIDVRIMHEALSIDRDKGLLKVKDIQNKSAFEQPYERLIIATGARAISPELTGSGLNGIFTLKSLTDGIAIRDFIYREKPAAASVIGGGYIGMEICESLARLGIKVTLIEALGRPMAIMDEDISGIVSGYLFENGINIITGNRVSGFIGRKVVEKVILENGATVDAQCVILGVGVAPNSDLASASGLELGERKAIWVDRHQRTTDPFIYAAGDCCTAYHRLLCRDVYIPLGLTANRQGRVCGENILADMSGSELSVFPGILGTAITKVFDLEIGRTGIGSEEIVRFNLSDITKTSITAKNLPGYFPGASDLKITLFFEKSSGTIKGAQLAGRGGVASRLDTIVAAISASMTVEDIYNLDMAYAPPFSPVWDPLLVAARSAMK